MTTITAKTILRSRNVSNPEKVLSTLLVRFPRCILSEVNTHRDFSRNTASSRAIPVKKMLEDVKNNPFIPLFWGKNQPGMQAAEELDAEGIAAAKKEWLAARDDAVHHAEQLLNLGLHKQLINRVLEPWMWTISCISSTEWDNFLELRDHSDAEPHTQLLAKAIRAELDREDNIQDLHPYEWHLPFITEEEKALGIDAQIKLSVARCASTSYKTVDGFDMTLVRAEQIYDKLVTSKPMHASPTEHVAAADWFDTAYGYGWDKPHLHANFEGFIQWRKHLEAQG